MLISSSVSGELKIPVVVAERAVFSFGEELLEDGAAVRRISFDARAGETYEWFKYVAVYTGLDADQPESEAVKSVHAAEALGFEGLFKAHRLLWDERWSHSDVIIEGDEAAQFALRYSIYQLLIIAPTVSEKVSIPARGLSGQVYKGAVFWDTEMFMLSFFLHSDPKVARNLMMYRIHTLDGARRKAAEYGFLGAFYAWESQDTGDDACTLFNVNDVFTE